MNPTPSQPPPARAAVPTPAPGGAHDVFISYSRKDADFARQLHTALEARGKDIWIDWQDIKPTAQWWAEILAAVDNAHAFVFLISEHSLASAVCTSELNHAVTNRKRLIPIVRGSSPAGTVPDPLKPINWLYFRDNDLAAPASFQARVDELISALETDLDHARAHTRLLVRAREWELHNRNAAYTLRGQDLRDAELWLTAGSDKQPGATPLQREYVLASRRAAIRRQRILTASALAAVVISTVLAVLAFIKSEAATVQTQLAEAQTKVAKTQTEEALRQRNEAVAQKTEAQKQATIALSRQLAAQAEALPAQRATSLPTAVLLAAEGLERAPTPEAVRALHRVLPLIPQRLALFPSNSSPVVSALSPSGRYTAWPVENKTHITSADTPETIVVSAIGHDAPEHRFDLPGPATAMAFSPDDRLLVIASRDHAVRGFPLGDRPDGPSWLTHTDEDIELLAFDADHRIIIGGKTTLGALDPANGHTFIGSRLPPKTSPLAISPDGHLAAAAIHNEKGERVATAFVDLKTMAQAGLVLFGSARVAFSADNRRAALGGYQTAAVVDCSTFKVLATFDSSDLNEGSTTNEIRAVALNPAGDRLATAESNNTVRLWDTATGRECLRIREDASLWDVAFSPDGRFIATAADEETSRLRDARTGEELLRCTHSAYCSKVAFSADGRTLLCNAFDVSAWDVGRIGEAYTAPSNEVPENLTLSPDGRFLVTTGRTNTARLHDARTGAVLKAFTVPTSPATPNRLARAVAFSPDNARLALLSEDNHVYLWSLSSGDLLARLGPVTSDHLLVFSPDGARLATVNASPKSYAGRSSSSSLTIWDLNTFKPLADFPTKGPVEAAAFSPDGNTIACHRVANDEDDANAPPEPIILVDLPAGAHIRKVDLTDQPADLGFEVSAFARGGRSVALGELCARRLIRFSPPEQVTHYGQIVSPDGRSIIVGCADKTVRIYDTATGMQTQLLRHDGLLAEHVTFSPDGHMAASIANNADRPTSDLWLIHTRSGAPITSLEFPIHATGLAFSPDNRLLIIAGDDGQLHALFTRHEDLITEARRRVGRPFSDAEIALYLADAPPRPDAPAAAPTTAESPQSQPPSTAVAPE